MSTLPPEPPDDYEKPENDDEEYHVAGPTPALSFCHGTHPPERSAEYVTSFTEGVVLN